MLEVEKISFDYGNGDVFRDVGFSVAPGETVALVGPNGAGKTTLLRVLAGLQLPGHGTVRADGVDAFALPLRYRRILGYLPEGAPVEPGMTVGRYLRFRARLKGEQSRRIRHRVHEALEVCGLADFAQASTDFLSPGLRKCVALAEALLLRPRVLLLDDVFAGLDPAARAAVSRILTANAFTACVIAGHELADMARFARRFLLLSGGTLKEVSAAEAGKALTP